MGALGLCNDLGKERRNRFPLPHPPISLAIFLTLEDAMRVAWERIHLEPRPPFNAATAQEADFTAEMHEVLRDELLEEESVDGFTKEFFHDVDRPEVKNFDGKKVGKRPDLLVKLVGRKNVKPTQDGIFVECKLMDTDPTSKRLYCDNGITRFTDGDYAWAMTEAMMVAYSRERKKPSAALGDAFRNRAAKVLSVCKLRDCPASPAKPAVAISVHRRSFPLRSRHAPRITLRHLWLQRPA